MSIDFSDNSITACRSGLYIKGGIDHIFIENNYISVKQDAIHLPNYMDVFGELKISDNIIYAGDFGPGLGTAVKLANPFGYNHLVSTRIENNYIASIFRSSGIHGTNLYGPNIFQNSIESFNNKKGGIYLEGCKRVQISCNDIFVTADENEHAGINALLNSASKYDCNNIHGDGNGLGMNFNGTHTSTYIKGNTFENFKIGLQIQTNGAIGQQRHQGNIWTGNFAEFEAKHLGMEINEWVQSFFIVDQDISPNFLPSNNVALGFWFDNQTDENDETYYCHTNNSETCIEGTGTNLEFLLDPEDELTIKLREGTFLSPNYTESLLWTGQRDLYKMVIDAGTQGYDFETFKSIVESGGSIDWPGSKTIRPFQEIENAVKIAFTPDLQLFSDLTTALEERELFIQELDQIISLLSETMDETEISSLIQDKYEIIDKINSASIKANEKLELIKNKRINAITDIQIANQEITDTEIFETIQKQANDLFLETVAIGNYDFTPEQVARLEHLACQCPLEAGQGVFLARAMYENVNSLAQFDDEALCQNIAEIPYVMTNNSESTATIWPNPAKKFTFIHIKTGRNDIDAVQLEVFDNLNRKVIQAALPVYSGEVVWENKRLETGIYFMKLHEGNENLGTFKIVVID